MTSRRTFLATLVGSILAAPLAAQAQRAGRGFRIVELDRSELIINLKTAKVLGLNPAILADPG